MKRPNSIASYASVASIFFVVAHNLQYLMRFLGLRRFLPPLAVLGLRNLLR